jgi:hypothetical protein
MDPVVDPWQKSVGFTGMLYGQLDTVIWPLKKFSMNFSANFPVEKKQQLFDKKKSMGQY